ncbi:YveK family protein [Janibacter melonis]|uniref:hypothetical protein n=1 Tax=Janibacter melonis TaxID=262209 RepID=UPI00174A68B8|nr:hypothetical protein [Janibacter melonis]
MQLRDVVSAGRRRWWVVVIGVLCALGAGYGAYATTPPTYEATATVLLLPPRATVEDGDNPLLQLGGLNEAVDVLVLELSSQDVRRRVEELQPDSSYEVVNEPSTSSPVLLLTVRDVTSQGALQIRDELLATTPRSLSALQSKITSGSDQQITSRVVSSDKVAESVGRDRVRSALIALVGVGVLTLIALSLVDGALRRRAERRLAGPGRRGRGRTSPPPGVALPPPVQGHAPGGHDGMLSPPPPTQDGPPPHLVRDDAPAPAASGPAPETSGPAPETTSALRDRRVPQP